MPKASTSYVNPSSLSAPSPSPSDQGSSPEPDSAPPRKRSRTDTSPEDRKEARAHRNRIAAQNSRDRRKAHFSFLERRVAELEEENRRLRVSIGLPSHDQPQLPDQSVRDRENEELRERIKTLEKGWDAVVKALAAQGTGISLPAPDSTAAPTQPSSAVQSTATSTTSKPASESDASTQAPQSLSQYSFPLSPAPSSHDSLEFDNILDLDFSSPVMPSLPSLEPEQDSQSTRHLAAGGLDLFSLYPINIPTDTPPAETTSNDPPPLDDAAMEVLFREILAPSPNLPSANLPSDTTLSEEGPASPAGSGSIAASKPPMRIKLDHEASLLLGDLITNADDNSTVGDQSDSTSDQDTEMEMNWQNEDMQRLLDMLPAAAAAATQANDGPCGDNSVVEQWDSFSATVGVF